MAKRKPIKKKDSNSIIFNRFMFIVALFAVWIGLIGVRLVHLQISENQWLRDKALNQRRDESRSKMLRGSIYDRSNRALAISVKVKSLYANPQDIEDVPATAQKLALVLKQKPFEISATINEAKAKGKRFVWLARKVDEDVFTKINEKLKDSEVKKFDEPKVKGLHWKEEQKRSYPQNNLAAQVIGFSDLDDKGKAGIELSQEEHLHGIVVKSWKDRDRLGRVYEESEEDDEREPPKDVVLTISNSIQYKVEEALREGVENSRAKSGIAIAMNPKTGEILAMANYPTFDLNKFGDVAPELYTNRAIQNSYAPGSIFKMIPFSGAIQEKLISPNEMLDCSGGTLDVAGRTFNDKHCINKISFTDAFAVSSNIGAIRTGQKLNEQRFYNYIRQFGFGETTGIELPAEAKGIVRNLENWNGDSLASMSIGYEIGVTALQSAVAFATIANDGVKVRPHIIKEIRQADGKVFTTTEAEKVQIVSAETARSLRQMMQKVVLSGTGKRAQLNGYTSAGKTGTAWKYDEKLKKINEDKYISSFIGFAPIENPAVVIAVILDEPQGAMRDGGHVSAPIFRSIAEQILPELNVASDGFVRQEITDEIVEGKEFKPTAEKTVEKKLVEKATEKTVEKVEKVEKETTPTNQKLGKDGKAQTPVTKPKTASGDTKPKNKSSGKEKT